MRSELASEPPNEPIDSPMSFWKPASSSAAVTVAFLAGSFFKVAAISSRLR